MKLLLNEKEIANYLYSIVDHKSVCQAIQFNEQNIADIIDYIHVEKAKKKFDLDKMRKKFKDKIQRAVEKDLENYFREIKVTLRNRKKHVYKSLHTQLDYFLKKLGEEAVLEQYKNSTKDGFVKSTGFNIDPNAQLTRRVNFVGYHENCLFRNTVGNERLLISKIDNKYPFWFIDSGYTNFIESNKKWHRLIKNHIHVGEYFDAPVDRLGIFKTFPQQWRTGGDKILVIEPGSFAAGIFHVDIETWKKEVETELRKYTDKQIVFREKVPKKTRPRLYKELCNEDYYCVVNINSNAATEAIWAGVPVITLDKHVTNPVARNSLSDINNLLRPNLANWLCMLSYSQFTYEELVDGTAASIVKKYHV
jgi:hypothetical protein